MTSFSNYALTFPALSTGYVDLYQNPTDTFIDLGSAFVNTLHWGSPAVSTDSLSKCINLPDNPPSNCYFSEDLNRLVLEFALAGRIDEEISVQIIGNSIEVTAKKIEKPEDRRYVKTGISGKEVSFTVNVDDAYSALKAEATFKEGILTITIPREEEQKTRKLL